MTRTRFLAADEVTRAIAEEAWALRLRYVRLRPEIDPTRDRERMVAYLQAPGGRLAMVRDAEGTLAGTLHLRSLRSTLDGEPVVVLVPEYGFVDETLRGTPPTWRATSPSVATSRSRTATSWGSPGCRAARSGCCAGWGRSSGATGSIATAASCASPPSLASPSGRPTPGASTRWGTTCP